MESTSDLSDVKSGNSHIDPAVHGSGLDWERKERTGEEKIIVGHFRALIDDAKSVYQPTYQLSRLLNLVLMIHDKIPQDNYKLRSGFLNY